MSDSQTHAIPLHSVTYEKLVRFIRIIPITSYPHWKSRWRTYNNGYISMMNHIITDTAQDGSTDRAQTPAAHDNHVCV